MKPFEPPSDFRMPISRVRCSTAMYMERQTTAKPITTPMRHDHDDELAAAPECCSTLNMEVNSSMVSMG